MHVTTVRRTGASPNSRSESEPSRGEYAYQAILRAIVKLELTPGQVISANVLSRTLGVSRTPVREALKRLESLGFVKSVPQSGTVVLGIDAEELSQAVEMRVLLEAWAVRRVAVEGESTDALRRLIDLQESARMDEDADAYLHADQAFHNQLAEQSGNVKLVEFLSNLNPSLMRARYWALRFSPIRVKESMAEHLAIADAIDGRDADAAEELMKTHIWNTFTTVKASVDRQSAFWT